MNQVIGSPRRVSWRIGFWAGAAVLLLLPLGGMVLTSEVNWGAEDFATAALLLGGLGLALEGTVRLVRGTMMRIAVGMAAVLVTALIWAQLAVGLF